MFEFEVASSRTGARRWAGELGGSAMVHAGLLAGLALLAILKIPEISPPVTPFPEPVHAPVSVLLDPHIPAGGGAGGGSGTNMLPPPPKKGQDQEAAQPPSQPVPASEPQAAPDPAPEDIHAGEAAPSGDSSGSPDGDPNGSPEGIPGGTGYPSSGVGPGGGTGVDGPGPGGREGAGGIADGSIFIPRLLRKVEPGYPAGPARARLEGDVILEVVVSDEGVPSRIDILKSDRLFDAAAIAAVRQWRWAPAMMNGRSVAVFVRIEVSFRMR